VRAGCAAQAAGTLSQGEERGPRRPRRGSRTPGPQVTSLAGGNGLICRLIVLLPAGNAVKTSPGWRGIRWAAGGRRLAGRSGQQPAPAMTVAGRRSSRC